MAASKARMSFFRLSAELRNRIYELALVEKGHVKIQDGLGSPPERPPALLHTCRQIRAEALPIYYKQNTFLVVFNRDSRYFKSTIGNWLCDIGRKMTSLIPEIKIRFEMPSCYGIDRYLSTHLERNSGRKTAIIQYLGLEWLGVSSEVFKVETQVCHNGYCMEPLEVHDYNNFQFNPELDEVD